MLEVDPVNYTNQLDLDGNEIILIPFQDGLWRVRRTLHSDFKNGG